MKMMPQLRSARLVRKVLSCQGFRQKNLRWKYLVTGDSEQNAKNKDTPGSYLSDAVSALSIGKKQLLKELLVVLQKFDVARKP